MYYVYILKSKKNGKLYCGYSTDLQQRFTDHNKGKSKYTRNFRPWVLVYYESYFSKAEAIEREKQLKHHGKVYTHLKRRIARSIHES